MMLWGGRDAIVDPGRCARVARQLEAGGSAVETAVYPDAVHQWDGRFAAEREKIGRASCRERVCQYVSISVVAVSLKTKTQARLTTILHVNENPPTTQVHI